MERHTVGSYSEQVQWCSQAKRWTNHGTKHSRPLINQSRKAGHQPPPSEPPVGEPRNCSSHSSICHIPVQRQPWAHSRQTGVCPSQTCWACQPNQFTSSTMVIRGFTATRNSRQYGKGRGGRLLPLREHFSVLSNDSFMILPWKSMDGAFTKSTVIWHISKGNGTRQRNHIMKQNQNKTQEWKMMCHYHIIEKSPLIHPLCPPASSIMFLHL